MNKNLIGIFVTVAVLAAIFVFHGKHRIPMSVPAPAPVVVETPAPAPDVIETPVVQPKRHVAAPVVHSKRPVQRTLKPRAPVKAAVPCHNSWHPERCNNPPECRGVFGCLN